MTHITIDPDRLKITAKGHAGAAERGEDLVCCAITTLMTAFAKEAIILSMPVRIDDSIPLISVQGRDRVGDPLIDLRMVACYRMTKHGLEDLAEQYPEFITIGGND